MPLEFINYVNDRGILTMATFFSAFTISFIERLRKLVLDPLFNYFFHDKNLKDYGIELPDGSEIQVGLMIIEVIRVLTYMILFYACFKNTLTK